MTKLHSIHLELTLQYITFMMSNNSTINVKTKNNRVNNMIKLHSKHLELTLQ